MTFAESCHKVQFIQPCVTVLIQSVTAIGYSFCRTIFCLLEDYFYFRASGLLRFDFYFMFELLNNWLLSLCVVLSNDYSGGYVLCFLLLIFSHFQFIALFKFDNSTLL
ncbi:Hypothetical predicted protein [Olea europaea subsp. europaea]|uniref:Uncharacterized protein n=1 Tax=Olea europaea subsp. europaea TaxID=158383 RepID=A0A8S0PAI5_OLEEU|nr:Hypothetical predicted protein [Olea europaea subsp. europaea]